MPTIDLTDAELAAVTRAIRRAIEEDRFRRAPRLDLLRSALAKLDPATPPPNEPPTSGKPAPKISPASSWAGCRPTADPHQNL
jgi:hypothetical protein